MLFLLVTSVVAWGQGYNDVRWPNYTATEGTAGHNDNEGYDKLFDNNTSTKWCVTTLGNPTYVQFDATRPIKPTYYTLTTGGDTNKYTGRNPKSWVIKASNDASNWTTIVTVTDGGMPTGNCESKTFSMGNLGTFYRYWRFEVNSVVSGTVFQLSEFSLLVDFTNLKHVFVEGLENTYYLTPSQNSINPQLTVRDLKGQTLAQDTYWKIGYYNSNNQYLSSVTSPGNYTLVISQGSTIYYSDTYEYPIKVTYGLDGSGTLDNPYTISSISDWNRLVNSLNAGKTYAGQYVSLQNDLDLEINSIILPSIMSDSNQGHVFSGTFLGNNHTITQTASYDLEVCGLFRWVKGATFKDLTVAGSISSSRKFMAAIVGDILGGNVTFDNCHVTATLNSSVNGDGTSAPFVGYQANGTVAFNNCSFTGSLIGTNTTLWSGMMGWGEGAVRATFSNCIFAPTTVNIGGNNSGATYARGRSGFTMTLGDGCYCTYQLDTAQGILVYATQQTGINKVIHAADGKDYYMTCTVSGVNSEYTYRDTPIQPVPTVTAADGTVLTEGTDYTLTYSDPTGRIPGQQSVTITATSGTYVGSQTISYTVVRDSSLPELQLGDVNYDDTLTIADVTLLVNMALGRVATNDLSDVNGDGSVTTEDAAMLVAIILGKPYSLTLSATSLCLKAGKSQQLTTTFTPAGEYTQTLEWTTSNAEVATVSSEGVVTAVGSGSCVVTCSAYGLTATCEVSVYSADDYVDLGLPSGTLWAKCNVGATEPKGYGSYFAWGETQPKATYTSANYTKSGITAMTAADDAATVNWGAAWQMPTKAEMEELFNSTYTTQEWTTENGITGVRITSKANGNSIFLPATGYYSDYTYAMNTNYSIYYWTSTLYSRYTANAYHLYGNKNSTPYVDAGSRYYGYSVRPVLVEKAVRLTSIQLSETTLTIAIDEASQLTATVLPANAETKTLLWTTSDAQVATVDVSGMVTPVAVGSCIITATTTDGTALSASCTVTVAPILNGHEYVDLGLPSGTLWATTNIGATSPEQSGLYFAWGDTIGYAPSDEHDFSWKNYIHSYVTEENNYDPNDGPFYLSKYNDKDCSYDGIMDCVEDLMPEDDAAFTNWGPNWRLPTGGQIAELFEGGSTTQTQTTRNGVQGLLFTSKTYPDRSIFIPAARHYGGSNLTFDNEGNIWIWAGTLNDAECPKAWHTAGYDHITTAYRCLGLPVRPVVAYRCVESVTLSATEITCAVGDTIDLTFTLLPADAVDKDVRWIEGNEDVVDVGWDGVITAVAPGKCKITVQAVKGGAAASCTVTVTE